MKNNKLFAILVLIIITKSYIFCGDFSYGPSVFNNYYFQPQNLGTSSPQVTEMLRFGNLSINNYYGLLNNKIELEKYKDNNFELSISLTYNSSGFIPSRRSSMVGLNWILEYGGIITRIVKGSPDDNMGNYVPDALKYSNDGILVAIKNGSFKVYSEQDLNSCNIEKYNDLKKNPYVNGDFKYDMEPDIFKFNFGSYSGSFIIGNTGVPMLLEENGCKIDIDSLTIQSYSTTETPKSSAIFITTPDGYKYSFGGKVNYFEYFIPDNPKKCTVRPRYITSWFLRSIEAPNKRKVLFTYINSIQKNKYFSFVSSISSINSITNCTSAYNITKNTPAPLALSTNEWINSSEIDMIVFNDEIHTPIIDNIKIDNTTIKFYTNKTNQGFYEATDLTDKSYQIYKISTFYGNEIRKNSDLFYINKDSYFFLDIVDNNGLKYKFDYNFKDLMPNPLTISVDHWGFWAGGFEIQTNNKGVYCANLLTNKAVKTDVCDNFLLKSIRYPTGGYTEIKYEYNRYSYYLERDINTLKLNLVKTDVPKPCGGSRVLSLTDYDNLSKIKNIKTFSYKNNINNGEEVGVIGLAPKYSTSEEKFSYSNTNEIRTTQDGLIRYSYSNLIKYKIFNHSSNTYGSLNNLCDFHISYPHVIEYNTNNEIIKYSYSSLLDIPDFCEQNYKVYIPTSTNGEIWYPYSNLTTAQLAEKHNLYASNEITNFKGKLQKKESYLNGSVDPIKTEIFKYNIDQSKDKYNISVVSSPMGYNAYKFYTSPCNLIYKEVIDPYGNSYHEDFKYNDKNFIEDQFVFNSDKSKKHVTYIYPFTASPVTNNNPIALEMSNKNIINEPVLILAKTERDNKFSLTNGVFKEYSLENNQILLKSTSILSTNTPLKDCDTYDKSLFIERDKYLKYNVIGNPLYIISKNNNSVVILWSYNYRYPIAEIKNSTYQQIEDELGSTYISGLASNPNPTVNDLVKLNALRFSTSLPDIEVTTFTYKPLVGMQTKTDPRGIVTTYKYDDFNRLENIKDNNGSVLQQYKYHYSNQK